MKYNEYKENKTHGSAEFPLEFYTVDESHAQYVMPLHWHGEIEVVRVTRGKLALWIDNEKIEMSSGDVAFVPCGAMHRGEPDSCRYECAVFSPRLVAGRLGSRLSELVSPILSSPAGILCSCPEAEPAANALLDAAEYDEPYRELRLAALVAELMYALCRYGAAENERSVDKRGTHRREVITLLLEHIEKNYRERITLADLARVAGVNEKYLCRFFKEFTGYTPTDYINRLRVERACYEMRVNRLNVTEAAYECGFNEISYFSKCFKKYKSVSPGKYCSGGERGQGD